jgi:N-acetylglutamate synthase-like GNAT family acetyltransferase
MNSIFLRTAEAADAAAIANLVNAAFRPGRFYSDEDRTSSAAVLDMLHEGKFLLAEEEGTLTGCVYVQITGDRGYLGLLSVDPSRQHSGLGTRMVAAVEEHCRSAGCHFIDLTFASLRTKLPGFYRRLGYIENGTEPFPADMHTKVPVHLVKMTKSLL